MKILCLGKNNYEIVKNNKDCLEEEELKSLFTEYFEVYDYVLGDYSYGKLRLKGFYESNNKNVKKINDIKYFDDYLKDYCAYQCSYFLLKKQINIEKQ